MMCALRVCRLLQNADKQWRNLCLNAFLEQLQSGQKELFKNLESSPCCREGFNAMILIIS